MGFEPTTLGATVQCSTVELHSPRRRPTILFTYQPRLVETGRRTRSRGEARRDGIKSTRQEGIEPPTYGLEGRCSIRLSYRRLACSVANLAMTCQPSRGSLAETMPGESRRATS